MHGRFFTNCLTNIIEKAVSICLIIPQNRKVKKFQLHIIDQSFEHNGMGISYQKKLESLEEKKAVHTSCKHGVRRICQLYTKGGPAGKLMWCEPPRDHLDYRRRDNIQRSGPKNTGQAQTVATLRLEECDFGHALGARTFYTSPLKLEHKSKTHKNEMHTTFCVTSEQTILRPPTCIWNTTLKAHWSSSKTSVLNGSMATTKTISG